MAIWAFDLDGTLCEAWYGENNPDFYNNNEDQTIRSLLTDCYEYVKPLPYINTFLRSISQWDNDPVLAVISRICNGTELPQKINFLQENFKMADGTPYFNHGHIFGVVNDEDKIHILRYLQVKQGKLPPTQTFYFDDNLSLIHRLYKECREEKIKVFHSSSLAVRTPYDIMTACDPPLIAIPKIN